MSQVLYYFFGSLINIDLFVCLFIVMGYFLWKTTGSKIGAKFLGCGVFILLMIGILPTSQWMIAHLENYFPQQQELPHDVKGIIVLGGSFDRSLSVSRDTSVFNMAGGRLIQAVALAKKYSHLPIVFTGAGSAIKNAKSEAHMAKDYFDAFGIDNQRIIYETESKDTIENASKSYALIKPQAADRWALVTSAIHMPRSVGLFEAQGWSILPYPVDYHSDGRFPYFQTPNLKKNFMIWAAAMKEWAGLISNRLYHITPSVLPALK